MIEIKGIIIPTYEITRIMKINNKDKLYLEVDLGKEEVRICFWFDDYRERRTVWTKLKEMTPQLTEGS